MSFQERSVPILPIRQEKFKNTQSSSLIKHYISLFANDTSLSCNGMSSADIEGKLNNDLEKVHAWLTANKLTLNSNKSEYMIIASRQKLNSIDATTTNISIAGQQITRVKSTESLGIIIDEQLKWHEHNNKQCKTISARIGMLRRSRDFVTQDVLITMYNSLVLPHLTYCSTVWHGSSADHISKLYKLQKRAARVITGSNYDIRSTDIFETLNWRPTKDNLDERDLVMTFKAKENFSWQRSRHRRCYGDHDVSIWLIFSLLSNLTRQKER